MRLTGRAALVALLATSGCAGEVQRLDAPRIVTGVELAAYAMHEECMTLETGERITYRFTAHPAVSFNIHYHEDNAVILPIDIDSTVEESGVFAADRPQGYCLMWEAGPQGSRLDYRVQPLGAR